MKKSFTVFLICYVLLVSLMAFLTDFKERIVFSKNDTTIIAIPRQGLDTIIDVKGKSALFIGDSHTANHYFGWQKIVCDKTKMRMINLSKIGKTTDWMLKVAKNSIHFNLDYCFIYGGANDMYSNSISPNQAIKNIQSIVNICKKNGVRCIVLTGFDPHITQTPNRHYIPRYVKFQKMLMDSIVSARVIDTRVVSRSDCGDGLCHMDISGHKKMADCVISKLKFKTY